jgi:hypothetical protein
MVNDIIPKRSRNKRTKPIADEGGPKLTRQQRLDKKLPFNNKKIKK